MSIFSVVLLLTLFRHPSADPLNEYMTYRLLRSDAKACSEYQDIVKELVPRLFQGEDLVSLVREDEAEHAILCERGIGTNRNPLLPTSMIGDQQPERIRCHNYYVNAATRGVPGVQSILGKLLGGQTSPSASGTNSFWDVSQAKGQAAAAAAAGAFGQLLNMYNGNGQQTAAAPGVFNQLLGMYNGNGQPTAAEAPGIFNQLLGMYNGNDQATGGALGISSILNSVQRNTAPEPPQGWISRKTPAEKLSIAFNHKLQMQRNPPSEDDARQIQSKTCTESRRVLEAILTKAASVAKGRGGIGSDWRNDPENVPVKKSTASKQFAESLMLKYPTLLCKHHEKASERKFHHKMYCLVNKGFNAAMQSFRGMKQEK